MNILQFHVRKVVKLTLVKGWQQIAANDARYRPVFRLTELGLGD